MATAVGGHGCGWPRLWVARLWLWRHDCSCVGTAVGGHRRNLRNRCQVALATVQVKMVPSINQARVLRTVSTHKKTPRLINLGREYSCGRTINGCSIQYPTPLGHSLSRWAMGHSLSRWAMGHSLSRWGMGHSLRRWAMGHSLRRWAMGPQRRGSRRPQAISVGLTVVRLGNLNGVECSHCRRMKVEYEYVRAAGRMITLWYNSLARLATLCHRCCGWVF